MLEELKANIINYTDIKKTGSTKEVNKTHYIDLINIFLKQMWIMKQSNKINDERCSKTAMFVAKEND